MYNHKAHGNKQETHGRDLKLRHQEVPVYVPPHTVQIQTILRYMELFEEQYPISYGKLTKDPDRRI